MAGAYLNRGSAYAQRGETPVADEMRLGAHESSDRDFLCGDALVCDVYDPWLSDLVGRNVMKVLIGAGQLVVVLMFLAVGLLLACGGLWLYVLLPSQDGVRTTGTIVRIFNGTDSGIPYQSPDVQFTTEEGRQFTVNMTCTPLDCFREIRIGSRVPVVYSRSLPQFAVADTFEGRWLTPLYAFGWGSVITLVLVSLVKRRLEAIAFEMKYPRIYR